ncbi:MAG: hypothetical protein RBR71_11530 [Gudongella sp.]|nr:hypothetical protein [Gudongella sp.]
MDICNNLDLMDECIAKMHELSGNMQDTAMILYSALERSDSSLSGKRQEMNRETITKGVQTMERTKEALESGCRDIERLRDCLEMYLSMKYQR